MDRVTGVELRVNGTSRGTTFRLLGVLQTVFKVPGVVRWAVFLLPLSWIGVTGGYALVTPMLVDAGWSAGRTGFIVGIIGSTVGGLAAVGAGFLVKRLGRMRVLALSLVLRGFSPLALGHAPFFATTVALCLFDGVYASGSVAINAITMDLTRPARLRRVGPDGGRRERSVEGSCGGRPAGIAGRVRRILDFLGALAYHQFGSEQRQRARGTPVEHCRGGACGDLFYRVGGRGQRRTAE